MHHRHPHILNASTNLLGICFVIIGGLKITGSNAHSYSDEIAWTAAALLLASTLFSYLAIRNNDPRTWQHVFADITFLGGVIVLSAAVAVAALFL
jgi:hypothetical protein